MAAGVRNTQKSPELFGPQAAARHLSTSCAGGQDDGSYTNSLKLSYQVGTSCACASLSERWPVLRVGTVSSPFVSAAPYCANAITFGGSLCSIANFLSSFFIIP